MNGFKENCIYEQLRTNIFWYLILNFFTCNLYYFYFQFKVTKIFKFSKITEQIYKEARIHLLWMLGTAAFSFAYLLLMLIIMVCAAESLFDFMETTGIGLTIFPVIITIIASNILSITWAYKIRSAIRHYNIAMYNVDYTSNGFLTFFCPGIVFIWAIENTPSESRYNSIKNQSS